MTTIKGWNPSKLLWFRRQLRTWGKEHSRDFPWRRTKDPYALLVAECLLQQTEATRVVPVYEQFLTRYPTVRDLASALLPQVSQLLHPLGFQQKCGKVEKSLTFIKAEIRTLFKDEPERVIAAIQEKLPELICYPRQASEQAAKIAS